MATATPTRATSGVPDVTRFVPWALRLAWLLTAVLGAPAVTSAVDGRSDPVRAVAQIGGAVVWAVGVAAMAIPAVVSLTATRAIVPLAPVAGAVTLTAGADGLDVVALVAPGAVATLLAFAAETGRAFVQASAYGDEDRHLLRPPFAYAMASVVMWCVWASALLSSPLLLAASAWIAGVVILAVAVACTLVLPRRWHRLARRWLVLVPAGIVLHDHVVLAETLMLRRSEVARIRLAPSDTRALDLTGPATGHAIEVTTTTSVTALVGPTPEDRRGRAVHLTAFLAAPTRPGRFLRSAAARRLPVG
jgi:hypothetical protein